MRPRNLSFIAFACFLYPFTSAPPAQPPQTKPTTRPEVPELVRLSTQVTNVWHESGRVTFWGMDGSGCWLEPGPAADEAWQHLIGKRA